ncbi:Gfo/Idh/MocA family oxidoreductase [Chitinophaga horti]|uniref:Gfo/Idh/MocA family oxidoreductase n=1 Tax=Chitinophaga horti TaxID=2920382 RepID=A0ABY6IXK5_9BACT|nr:Gfo/Idh/MocA family oxidoreductase [Chitinophaga horti]UYQ92123.1 Gfo/Idh/MocA family oxidoreductase [Chitinophaga horti]
MQYNNRRGFLKKAAAGTGGLLLGNMFGYASAGALNEAVQESARRSKHHKQLFNMCGYAAPKLPVVRIGYVGIGNRGGWAVERMMNIKNAEIVALCDTREVAVKGKQASLKAKGRPAATEYFGDVNAYKKLCENPNIDLVYIATPWEWHANIAIYAMEHGKHVALEVPGAITLEDCWKLVETSERTKKHCMQLENCCYDFFETLTINMAQQGLMGEIVHGEGAYIHTLLDGFFHKPRNADDAPGWRWKENLKNGNLYPTHGLGPVAQAMNINRGDKMEYLTSMSTNDFMMEPLAEKLAAGGDPYYQQFAGKHYRGNMNTSVVKTNKGKTIMIQHDVSTPRPYSRLHVLSGTKGYAQKYPEPGKIAFGHYFLEADKVKELEEKYTPEVVKHVAEAARVIGGHGGMDFIMDWRMIDCLRNGLPLDIDVYDLACWSAITPLTTWSVTHRSNSIDVPDFTGGSWKLNKPVDLSLRGGGNTAVISLNKEN